MHRPPPFRANAARHHSQSVDDTPRPIREVNPEIPAWLCDIIDRLLAKDPDDRFQTAAEVATNWKSRWPACSTRRLPAAGRTGARATLAGHRETPPGPQVARGDRLAGCAALLAGIIIKITSPDGTQTEIKVPEGAKVEIVKEGSPRPKAKDNADGTLKAPSSVATGPPPTGIGIAGGPCGGSVLQDRRVFKLKHGDPLPDGDFHLSTVDIRNAPVTSADLDRLADLPGFESVVSSRLRSMDRPCRSWLEFRC